MADSIDTSATATTLSASSANEEDKIIVIEKINRHHELSACSFNFLIVLIFTYDYANEISILFKDNKDSPWYYINLIWLGIGSASFLLSHGSFSSRSIEGAAKLKLDPKHQFARFREFVRIYFGTLGAFFHQTVMGFSYRSLLINMLGVSETNATALAVWLALMAMPLMLALLRMPLLRPDETPATPTPAAQEKPRTLSYLTDFAKKSGLDTYYTPKVQLTLAFFSTIAQTLGVGTLYIRAYFNTPVTLETREFGIAWKRTLGEKFAYFIIIAFSLFTVLNLTTSFFHIAATTFFKYKPQDTKKYDQIINSIKQKTSWILRTALSGTGTLFIFSLLRKAAPDSKAAYWCFLILSAFISPVAVYGFVTAMFKKDPVRKDNAEKNPAPITAIVDTISQDGQSTESAAGERKLPAP